MGSWPSRNPGLDRCEPYIMITTGSAKCISRCLTAITLPGTGCRRDEDGYFWITGRVDDVINVSGHRMGTAEVESALVSHPQVAEAR